MCQSADFFLLVFYTHIVNKLLSEWGELGAVFVVVKIILLDFEIQCLKQVCGLLFSKYFTSNLPLSTYGHRLLQTLYAVAEMADMFWMQAYGECLHLHTWDRDI